MPSEPKKQHHVPRFYLEKFIDKDGYIHVYDFSGDAKHYKSKPENTGYVTGQYSTPNITKNKNNELEKIFSGIESVASIIHRKLLNCIPLVANEKLNYANFLATQYLRTPVMQRSCASVFGALLEKALKLEPENNIDMKIPQKIGLQGLQNIELIGTILYERYDWFIIKCAEQHFITSDNPAVLVPTKNQKNNYSKAGFLLKDVQLSFPLSPEKMLVLDHPHDGAHYKNLPSNMNIGVIDICKKDAKHYNKIRAKFADRALYSSKKDDGIRQLGVKHTQPGEVRFEVNGGASTPIEVSRHIK